MKYTLSKMNILSCNRVEEGIEAIVSGIKTNNYREINVNIKTRK